MEREGCADTIRGRSLINLSDLKPAPFNPREIEAAAIKGLGTSIAEFGDISGIVWNRRNGYLVAGHQRLKALTEQGAKVIHRANGDLWWLEQPHEFGEHGDCFPIRTVDWPDDKHKAAMVAANSQLLAGEFIDDQLVDMVDELKESDLAGLIEPLRLEELVDDLRLPIEVQQDEVPEPPKEPVTRLGDLWTMGEHRVLCGDSTLEDDITRLMAGALAQLVFTDPPYGVDIQERDMAQAEVRGRRKDGKGVPNDDLTGEQLGRLLIAAFKMTLGCTHPGACWYVCAPSGVDYRCPLNILADLGVARHGLVWVKDRFVMGRADYHYRHENIIYGWSPGGAHKALSTRAQGSVWEFVRPSRSPEHPTMKPVALVTKAIVNSSDAARIVLDPFLGSGTTLIAAHQLGRRCYGIEIEPRYVDVTCQRFLNLTGESPIRESDEARFADLTKQETTDG